MAGEQHEISIVGLLKDVDFHMVKGVAEQLHQKEVESCNEPQVLGLLECDWNTFLENKKKEIKGEMWGFKENVIVFIDGQLIGGKEEFLKWTKERYNYQDLRPLPLWYAMAKESYKNHLVNLKHEFVYMDIEVANKKLGRIIIELYTDQLPKTCGNFKQLIVGNLEENERHEPPLKLRYKDSVMHRIVPNGWIQGGDIEGGRGVGGESVYGPLFEDESFSVPHNKRGVVGMANKGRHTNGSQFYITLQPAPWMNTKYVAFAQVIEGLSVLDILEEQETFNERPKTECRIAECGVLDAERIWT